MPSLFLEHGRRTVVGIEPGRRRHSGLLPSPGTCTVVLVLGGRSTDFTVERIGTPGFERDVRGDVLSTGPSTGTSTEGSAREDDARERSASGTVLMSRCGAERDELRHIAIEMRSPRAALEVVVATMAETPADIREILPERTTGPLAPRGDPGRAGDPGPLLPRLRRAEKWARADGAETVTRISMQASSEGTGEFALRLSEGCHRLLVLADSGGEGIRPIDVDAEARDVDSRKVLARDRAETPDARLDFCLGEPKVMVVPFVGAPGAVTVTAADAVWPISESIPKHWGPRARAGFAGALVRRHSPKPSDSTIKETLGGPGRTTIPIEVEPGACYVAALALMRGETRGLRMAATIGARTSHDDVSDRPEGAAIAFCSESEDTARLVIDVRGGGPWWALVVWPMTRMTRWDDAAIPGGTVASTTTPNE